MSLTKALLTEMPLVTAGATVGLGKAVIKGSLKAFAIPSLLCDRTHPKSATYESLEFMKIKLTSAQIYGRARDTIDETYQILGTLGTTGALIASENIYLQTAAIVSNIASAGYEFSKKIRRDKCSL